MNRLEIKNLKIVFHSAKGFIGAVKGIDISIEEGKCVGLVGESGSGKSVTGLSIMGLLQSPPAIVRADQMSFRYDENKTIDLLKLNENEMNCLRLKDISMVFQDPSSTLNPVLTIGEQMDEIFIYHKHLSKKEAKEKTIELLKMVQIPSPLERYNQFPHELSGGMKQRIIIAMAFSLNPKLIIADEPTTALDVSIQAQVLSIFKKLKDEFKTSVLFITHDLSVVRAICDEVYVLYNGKILEHGMMEDILNNPMHPYTKGLIDSIPDIEDNSPYFKSIKTSDGIKGGCIFCDRCEFKRKACEKNMPLLKKYGSREIRCFRGEVK